MADITEEQLRELRQKYQAAYEGYRSCVKALAEAELSGERLSAELLANESKALRELTEAREQYRDALMRGAFVGDDPLH